MEECQLLTQSRFVFAQRVDPSIDRCHMLTKVQIQVFDKAGIDLPTPLGQDGFDGRGRAEDDAVCDSDDVPETITLDHLRIEQFGQRYPAGFGLRPFRLAALGVHPPAVMRDARGKIFATPVCEKQWGTVRCQHPGDLMHQALGHGQSAISDVDGQGQLAHGSIATQTQ
jgi:hypothetical protein